MITLYDYLPSQNAWKVRLLLSHLNRPYRQEFISIFEGEGKRAEFLAMNPTGAVPVIKLEDGTSIAESNAILWYLAQQSDYLPAKPQSQARVMQWLFFEADYVQSSVATLRHWMLTGKDKNRSDDVLESKREASVKVLSVLDASLKSQPFLAGDAYTIADMSVFAYVHLAEDAGIELAPFHHLERWIQAVQGQPRFCGDVFPYSMDSNSFREL